MIIVIRGLIDRAEVVSAKLLSDSREFSRYQRHRNQRLTQPAMATRVNKIILSKETREWLMSTHFWGPAMNWAIPLAAISDTRKDPKLISGKMTLALTLYSLVFMRFAFVVKPRNLLLFSCHVVNMGAQLTQGTRFLHYHYLTSGEDETSTLKI